MRTLPIAARARGAGYQIPGQRPKLRVSQFFARIALDAEEARQNSNDVAVKDWRRLVKSDAANRAGRISANTRQRQYVFEMFRKFATILVADDLRRLLQIARPSVVAEPFPKLENSFRSGFCQGGDAWQLPHPSVPVRDDGLDLSLLEHDFGNPNAVGVARPAPGEIASVFPEPRQQCRNERWRYFLLSHVAENRQSGYDDTRREFVKPLTSYTCKLDDQQAAAVKAYLEEHGYKFREVPYARFAAEKEKTNVVFYESGKLVLQGKGTQEFIEFVLEPEILKEARLGYEAVLNPDLLLPRLGVDESGKGDFFGPLCVAGVYVNETVVKAWKDAGIRDSKNISSDKRMADLSELIRKTPGCVCTVVPIGNEAYNRLYEKMRSVNTLLAWGHARVIENLMGQKHRMDPPPVRAISDQFASNKQTVASALMSLGRQIELVQRHKAEADLAVAAASILARHEFVTRLAKLEKQFELKLPKGASAAVDAAAKEFVSRYGAQNLVKVAKMHFRTALRAQDLPEPPKREWRR